MEGPHENTAEKPFPPQNIVTLFNLWMECGRSIYK